ncbi:preprotein translocase subunit SecA [Brevibacterium album]|uniref:preprotein translocase subunit SecA n=1 Tax=Brevibacterium album TaxID=417948 RepID=UPI0003FD8659|nr:preprotein translocase subunit SecA [Brevibacterium album]
MANLLEKLLRTGEGRTLKRLRSYTAAINGLASEFEALSDTELREETDRFRKRHEDGESLESLLPEAFAAVREASSRTLGLRHFDVQLMGGAALHLGNIAEMRTGEGKTLVATAPAYLNALTGGGVHIVTVNDYLAGYQSDLMGRVFRFLGMETGCIKAQMSSDERRKQYAADITYGTNNEFGFDYLRDNMAWSVDEMVQRGHNFAIVDEVDSILIDEARTPLIISGPAEGGVDRWYGEFARVVTRLRPDRDYEVDEKKRTIGILESGIDKVEDYLGIGNLYDADNTPLISFLNNAIRAKELFKRDKDYVVLNGEVLIVDEHTGRVLRGRRYNEGLHQSIEAKEGVEVKAENQTLATITLQNYFRLYGTLSGMTGTAETEAAEFMSTYKLGVVPIPTNKPPQRLDQADVVYKNEQAKFTAIVDDIAERHEAGQPVLIGTTNVEKSELLSKLLAKRGVRHEVLNAKNHAREASIIAMAGSKGAVTVATNMAGRGTDIMLGGNAEFLAVAKMQERGLDAKEDPEAYEAAWPEVLAAVEEQVDAEAEEVRALGGLYVLGTERHESRRIDNQLKGRSGRQGDPGESRFYLSLTDDLMRLFGSGAAERIMAVANVPDDVPLEAKMVSRAIQSAQSQVESRNAEQRKNVLKYDDVLNRQRTVIYDERRRVLEGADLEEQVDGFRRDVLTAYVEAATQGPPETWDLDSLFEALGRLYTPSFSAEELIDDAGGKGGLSRSGVLSEIMEDADLFYRRREEELGEEAAREMERRVTLSVIDRKWREHLYEMDYLKNGIGLRAMAQRDPLVEYQREGFDMFTAMQEGIKEDIVRLTNTLEVKVRRRAEAPQAAAGAGPATGSASAESRAEGEGGVTVEADELRPRTSQVQLSAPSDSGGVQVRSEGEVPAEEPANRAERRKRKR